MSNTKTQSPSPTFDQLLEQLNDTLDKIEAIRQMHPDEARKLYKRVMVLIVDLMCFELGVN